MSYHESWLPQIAGVSAAFLIPGADGTISPSESCVVGVIPWQAGFSIRVPEAVNVLSLMVNQLIPGLVVDGAIQPLAVNEGEGLLLRFAPGPGVTNVPCRAWLLARSSDTALVVIIATASPTTPTDRESVLRAMAQSVRFTGESIQSTQAAWGPGLAPGQGTPSPRGASPAPGSAGALDPNLVGTWVSETAMSSPAPWSDLGQGGTSLAFLTVYVFGPDGNYALGSQAAGGNGDIGMDTGFSLSARGRWMVTQAPDEKGVLRTFILLTDQFGRQNQVRYTFHNGQLVLGGEGQRSFWSRR